MRALIRSLAPTRFEDVAALVALYRPGPMAANMHTDYADRKNGRKPVTYHHPDLEEILGPTYGLMIYQEQLMRVVAEARRLHARRGRQPAQGHRQEDPRAHREGAHEVRRRRRRAGSRPRVRRADVRHHRAVRRLLVQQVAPVGYGFVAYQTAYLKANHPVEYLAALLTSVKGDKDKPRSTSTSAAGSTSRCSSPTSTSPRWTSRWAPARRRRRPGPGAIRFGLSAVRNVGEGVVPRSSRRATTAGRSSILRLLRAGRPRRAEEAHDRVADQGRRVRLARPSPPGPGRSCSSRSST